MNEPSMLGKKSRKTTVPVAEGSDEPLTPDTATVDDQERQRGVFAHELEIRELEIDDIAPVYHLGEKVFTAERWPTLYRTWDEYEVISAFQTDGETSLVATLDDRVIGFALGTVIEKARNPWVYGYLKWLAVDPDFGQGGVGAALVKELRALFIEEGARMLLVDTEGDNERALRFFRKLGFGHETEHVYLSLNLTHERDYKRSRARRKKGGE